MYSRDYLLLSNKIFMSPDAPKCSNDIWLKLVKADVHKETAIKLPFPTHNLENTLYRKAKLSLRNNQDIY